MAFLATFVHGGNPNSLPTLNTTDFDSRGSQVSELAHSLNPPDDQPGNPPLTPPGFIISSARRHFGPTGPTGSTGVEGPTGATGATGHTGPDTKKVPAENIRSGITMPHFIPQVALDHSRALQGTSSGFPTPPGQNNGNN